MARVRSAIRTMPDHPALCEGGRYTGEREDQAESATASRLSRQHLYDIVASAKPCSLRPLRFAGKWFGDGAGVWVRRAGGVR